MNPFEMVLGIVIVTAIASVLRARLGVVRHGKGEHFVRQGPDPETERLRAEVKALKDRVAVLERLATDSSTQLEREFDKLRSAD